MALEFTKVLCLLCVVVALAVVEIESSACGENLDILLASVCTNGYNGMTKRSHVEDGLVGFGPFAEPSLLQRMLGESSRGLVKSRRMRRMGIIEECCKNTCSYEEMKNYCL